MHYKALISTLFALPYAMAAVRPCYSGVEVEAGGKCFLEGYEFCDANCDKAVCPRPIAFMLLTLLTATAPRYDSMFTDGSVLLENSSLAPMGPTTWWRAA